ncbi:unnamed protein product [Boreogadus saida]
MRLLSRLPGTGHLFFSPVVDLTTMASSTPTTDAMDGDSASVFSRSRITTATVVQHKGPRRMTDLFGEIMGGDPSTLKAPMLGRQSAAAVNNIALLSSAMVSLSADREAYGLEEAARWLAVSRFSSAILQLCQPIAVSAGYHDSKGHMALPHCGAGTRAGQPRPGSTSA